MPINKANNSGGGDSGECCRSTSLPMETVAGNDEAPIQQSATAAGRPSWTVGTKVIHRAFDDIALEELYQNYCQRSRESDLDCFFLTGCLVAVHSAVSFSLKQQDQALQSRVLIGAGVSSVVAVAQASLGFYIRGRKKKKNSAATATAGRQADQQAAAAAAAAAVVTSTGRLTYASWLLANMLILGLLAFVPSSDQGSRALTWLLLINFLTCVTLPLRLRVCLFLTSITSLLFLAVSAFTSWDEAGIHRPTLHQQLMGETILLVGSISLGLVAYLVADIRLRRAFLDTRQSFEMRLTIESQAREQEQLLLSVLPEHVAVKMRQDLGTAHDGQFKKIYMSRHENVSILFADIVGFTAISSTYPASELVHILNELFARFDRLSQRYHQMRIKILGDCYYCICGAPVERPDHAVLCVYMGLAMIDAIKCVRESTSSPVDMRVGIHTGAVLAGVLGQRQWQFDVYSQDVELANKMESSGQPGRVHVSSRTLSFLGDEFEVEAAHGEKREQVLRTAGIETYFILRARNEMNLPAEEESSKVINDHSEATTMAVSKVLSTNNYIPEMIGDAVAVNTVCQTSDPSGNWCSCFQRCSKVDKTSLVVVGESAGENRSLLRPNHLNEQQHFGPVGIAVRRSSTSSGAIPTNLLTQTFVDPEREAKYRLHRDATAVYNLLALPLALTWLAFFALATSPWSPVFILFFPLIASLLLLVVVGVADTWENCDSVGQVKKISALVNGKLGLRCCLVILGILLLVGAHLSGQGFNRTFPCPTEASLVLISVAMVPHLASYFKGTFLLLLSAVYICLPWLHYQPTLDAPCWFHRDGLHIQELILASCVLLVTSLVLFSLTRQLESTSRSLYTNWAGIEEQRERAADLGRRNQALLFNILPAHVAQHFLRKDIHQRDEQLYSQSYTSVGVLFASIPNFSEFYSEETVNNQGLECLRFLNEVISDFDALLDQSQFSEMTKIKTIGSTYMAASGLNITLQPKEDEDILTRWKHLALLVEFALSMQRTLQNINDQSFNHFVLRMGINHGPTTAGVIGATKPHYDIWGNAVNVASRMESTGKAGCIQVTEETSAILRHFGYQFEQRGLVFVKGKGQLLTYYLIESDASVT
ncbi:adenylate cyclase type 3-like [Daphnia pulex]|uniref:adenylate cyclase type 3-like n=1 Tax=Daphnia pulex TaxID=6669 RepID=UPI001EE0E8EA|nr:adenylate cyclase type 3-like [Daphnia pulex]